MRARSWSCATSRLQPGAASRLERHEHEHYVIVKRGLGYAVIGDTRREIGPNDVIYVAPLELHQFVNRSDEPFGFYCIVDSCRDFLASADAGRSRAARSFTGRRGCQAVRRFLRR